MPAVYEINEMVKRILAKNVVWNDIDAWPVAHRVSIVPAQVQPEQAKQTSDKPYIVYDYITTPSTNGPYRKVDEVTYTIWHQDIDLLKEMQEVLSAAFSDEDDSADFIHKYIVDTEYNYYYFQVPYAFSPEPEDEEGGRYSTGLVIRYDYSRIAPRTVILS